MRFFKTLIVIIILLGGGYAASMYYFVDESKNFIIENEIDYSVDKVFTQFNNLQNFTRWNNFFTSSPSININYYMPYEGQGSAISYVDPKNDIKGEMSIRYENPNITLKFQLFEEENENPTLIDIKFRAVSAEKTKIIWYVHTPKLPVWKRVENFWTEEHFAENINKSIVNLEKILENKVERDKQTVAINYGRMMVENEGDKLLLGINVSSSNKKDALFKNIVKNYNKVYNFVTMDLGKKEDEFGYPVLITDADNYKDREVSYFLGIPISNKVEVFDNNFSFKKVTPSKNYDMYYKGSYEGRIQAIEQLIQKAKKDKMYFGDVCQTFIEPPEERQEVNLKISLSVSK